MNKKRNVWYSPAKNLKPNQNAYTFEIVKELIYLGTF